MRFHEAIAALGRPKTLGEAIAAIRADHGDQAADAAVSRVGGADAAVPTNAADAIEAIRADHGRGATRWLADRFGVSLRQAQRWMQGRGLSGRTAGNRARRDQVVEAAAAPRRAEADRVRRAVMRQASPRWVAAAILRRASRVTVGRVRVWDKSKDRPDGSRDVGTHSVGRTLDRGQLNQVADLLEQDEMESALHAMSDALLDAYSRSKGDPAGTASGPLYIYDYPSGIGVET